MFCPFQAINWDSLRPRRANSVQFPITADDRRDDSDVIDTIIVTSLDKKSTIEPRRQSLPAFR